MKIYCAVEIEIKSELSMYAAAAVNEKLKHHEMCLYARWIDKPNGLVLSAGRVSGREREDGNGTLAQNRISCSR